MILISLALLILNEKIFHCYGAQFCLIDVQNLVVVFMQGFLVV
jgi:hypothetical protein